MTVNGHSVMINQVLDIKCYLYALSLSLMLTSEDVQASLGTGHTCLPGPHVSSPVTWPMSVPGRGWTGLAVTESLNNNFLSSSSSESTRTISSEKEFTCKGSEYRKTVEFVKTL